MSLRPAHLVCNPFSSITILSRDNCLGMCVFVERLASPGLILRLVYSGQACPLLCVLCAMCHIALKGCARLGSGEGGDARGRRSRWRLGDRAVLARARARVASGIRRVAEVTADRISALPLRLALHIKALNGPVCLWLPPPPSDRLWLAFLKPPELRAEARPEVCPLPGCKVDHV